MEMQSSRESKSQVITTQGSVKAFMEMILNTSLPLKPSLDPPIDLQQLIAKQVHAVVVLYNYYQRKRHPELEFLEFESFCRLAANLQPELVPYMRGMHQSDYNSSDVSEDQLSLTEKAIMDACKVCLALYDVPEHMPIKEEWPISKIVVMLVDPSKENCLNIFSSVTRGVWSFLEQSIDSCKISLEGTAVRKKRRISIKDTREEQNTTEAGYKQLAVSAIKNFTGLKKTELVFLESHVVYSVSKEKTAARFYIVKCAVKFPEKLYLTYWAPMKEVVESLQGPLANWHRHIGEWTPTLVIQSYHLLPYAKILSNYFSSKVSSGCLNDTGVMVSTSNSNTNESSDATIMSSDKEDMAGPTFSVSRLHTLDKDKTDAVSTPKEDKTKNDCTARKVYQHYRRSTSTRRDVTVSTLSVKDKIASDLDVKRKVPDFKADKQGNVKKTVSKFKVDKLCTVNKSCNIISGEQDKMPIAPFQKNTNSPEKVQTTCSAKEKELSVADRENALSVANEEELSVAAFRGLLSKRDILTQQLRNLGDEIAICDKNIQTISDTDKQGNVENTVSKFKVDKLCTVNKSCNNISGEQDKMSIAPFQKNTNSPEKVQTTCSAKEKELSVADRENALSVANEEELSVAAFRGLLSKRDILTQQLRNLGDEIAICDKNIQTISDTDKQGNVENTVSKFKVDKLCTVNKSCNNISGEQDKMSIAPFQKNTNSPEKVQTTCSAKEKELSVADRENALSVANEEELSVAAFRGLLSKRDILTHQLRNLGDEIAICDKNIQTISDNGKDSLPLKIDSIVDRCSDVRVKGKAVQDGTFQHGKDQVFSEQVKGKSIIDALIPDQISCQVLDRICHDQKWTSPTYSISPCDGGYIANVTVKGDDFEWLVNDRVHSCLKEAKDSAAMQMIEKLRSFVTNDWFFVI